MLPGLPAPTEQAARARPLATLVVEGQVKPFGCPDAQEIARRVDKKLGEGAIAVDPETDAQTHASVHFFRRGNVHYARVMTEGLRPGTRDLNDDGTTCAGLSEAVVLALSLVLDPAAPYEAAEARAEPSFETSLELGPVLSQGLLPGLAAGTALGLWTRVSREWAARLGATYWFAKRQHLGTTSVLVGLMAGDARVCRRHAVFGAAPSLDLSVCLFVTAGALSGEAAGFRWNRRAVSPWVTAGLGVRLGGALVGPLEWAVSADASTPLADDSFSIDGLGIVYRSSRVGFVEGFYVGVRLF